MSEIKHTKLPWVGFTDQGKLTAIMPAGRDGDICTFAQSPNKADGEFMLHAIRNHYPLMKSLLRLHTLLDFGDDALDHVWEFEDLSAIQAAFTEAKEALNAALAIPAPPVEAESEVGG